MGMIINIDEALKLRTDYNVLKEPLHAMMASVQEAWEKENPIDLIYNRGSLSGFQETYTSSIGFDHAFAETSDYAIGPIFNTAEGFSATYRSRTFQGSFIITQQAIEDRQVGTIKDDANAFMKRWHGDVVEYAMKALDGGFARNDEVYWGYGKEKSRLKLTSADTSDGDIMTATKNPLFYKNHTTVKREGMSNNDVVKQSNIFHAAIDLAGNDSGKIAKLADLINQVITEMENYKDDNGKRAVVNGAKTIVCANDPRLKAALETALAMDQFKQGESMFINPAFRAATVHPTVYLNDLDCTANGVGFFIIDKAYNAANHGPEFTERIPLTLEAIPEKRPKGIIYDGRQRFDINVASWRGIAYVNIGTLDTSDSGHWNYNTKFTEITVGASIATPVTVIGTVTTETAE